MRAMANSGCREEPSTARVAADAASWRRWVARRERKHQTFRRWGERRAAVAWRPGVRYCAMNPVGGSEEPMETLVAVVALVAVLLLVGRGTPLHSWPLIVAATLAVVVAIVLLERNGYWPA